LCVTFATFVYVPIAKSLPAGAWTILELANETNVPLTVIVSPHENTGGFVAPAMVGVGVGDDVGAA
jgi:hypothetical protein